MDTLVKLPPETIVRPGHTDPVDDRRRAREQRVHPRLARPGPRGRRAVHGARRAGDARAVRRRLRRRAQGLGPLARRPRRHRSRLAGPAPGLTGALVPDPARARAARRGRARRGRRGARRPAAAHGRDRPARRDRGGEVRGDVGRQPRAHARRGRRRARAPAGRRRAPDRARARVDEGRRDEGRPDAVGRRPRGGAARLPRRGAGDARRAARLGAERRRSRDMQRVLEREYGERLDRVFATFDEEPVAAASIGQVYRATLGRRARGRRQGPVPRDRRGGARRPAEPRADAADRQADRAEPRRPGPRRRGPRADPRGARLRARGAEHARGRRARIAGIRSS